MLKAIINNGGQDKLCGGCIDARGLAKLKYFEGCEKSIMKELAQWSV